MKNIYKITKGQLIATWIFGLIGFVASLDQSDYSGFATFLAILIPALLVFYTIGWRASNNKIKEKNNETGLKIGSILPSKKKLITTLIVILLAVSMILGVLYFIDIREENLKKEQLKQDYSQAILKVDSLKEKVASCIKPVIDKKYQEEVRSCNLLKNKIKHDYNFCVSLDMINSPASCLYDHDYESIDCSQETLEKKSRLQIFQSDFPTSCSLLVGELEEVNAVIAEYTKINKEE